MHSGHVFSPQRFTEIKTVIHKDELTFFVISVDVKVEVQVLHILYDIKVHVKHNYGSVLLYGMRSIYYVFWIRVESSFIEAHVFF